MASSNNSTASRDSLENNPFLETAHNVLGVGGIATGIGKFSNVMDDMWRGQNGKWYERASSFFGNQHTGSKNAVIETAKDYENMSRLGSWLRQV